MTKQEKRAKHAAYMRAYRVANLDKMRAAEKRYRTKHSVAYRARARARYMAGREKRSEWQKKYSAQNSERIIARVAAWQKANPQKVLVTKRKASAFRRASQFQATPPWVDRSAIHAIYARAVGAGLTVDHIVPLCHPSVCGLHVPWNLQLLTASENSVKKNRFEA